MLLVFDEASAVADVIWEVAEGALTDEDTEIIWCAFGNPIACQGGSLPRLLRSLRPSLGQAADRQPHCEDDEQGADGEVDRGLRFDSDFVKVRVLGQFPSADVSALFNPDTLRESMKRRYTEREISFAPKITGVDVARQGMDDSVFCHRQGLVMFLAEPMHIMDTVLVSSGSLPASKSAVAPHGCLSMPLAATVWV